MASRLILRQLQPLLEWYPHSSTPYFCSSSGSLCPGLRYANLFFWAHLFLQTLVLKVYIKSSLVKYLTLSHTAWPGILFCVKVTNLGLPGVEVLKDWVCERRGGGGGHSRREGAQLLRLLKTTVWSCVLCLPHWQKVFSAFPSLTLVIYLSLQAWSDTYGLWFSYTAGKGGSPGVAHNPCSCFSNVTAFCYLGIYRLFLFTDNKI